MFSNVLATVNFAAYALQMKAMRFVASITSTDITSMLSENNVIDVTVGKGWYRGQMVGWRYKNIYGRKRSRSLCVA